MTSNCNCKPSTQVHGDGCPANVANREFAGYHCRCGDVIVIPDYLGGDTDHAFMVVDTFPYGVNVFNPDGNKAYFDYKRLSELGAYHIWNRPVQYLPTN